MESWPGLILHINFQHSLSEGEAHGDDQGDSMTTQVGNSDQNEEAVTNLPISRPFSPEQEESTKASIRKTGYEQTFNLKQNVARYLVIIRWLEVKTVLIRKNRKVAMASKRKWKKYWGEYL